MFSASGVMTRDWYVVFLGKDEAQFPTGAVVSPGVVGFSHTGHGNTLSVSLDSDWMKLSRQAIQNTWLHGSCVGATYGLNRVNT